ncbi:MAG: hypothetical protein AAGA77_23845 [Bacteroidota bacterium]
MKKGIPLLFIVFSFCMGSYAQDSDELSMTALTDFEFPERHNTQYHTKTKSRLSLEDRLAKAKAYDLYVANEFGSYLNPYNGNLYIINDEEKRFNRAQFMKEGSHKKMFSLRIDQRTKTINLENYAPGEYMLILSNDKGDLLVESFIII